MLGIEDYGSGSENESDNEVPLKVTKLPPKVISSTAKAKRPKKFTIGLPNLPLSKDDDSDDLRDERPPTKKPRLGAGAGASSLLSMLPAPMKEAAGSPPVERVLGAGKGPGLVFNNSPNSRPPNDDAGYNDNHVAQKTISSKVEASDDAGRTGTSVASPFPFLPPSLTKGRANVSVEDIPPKAVAHVAARANAAPTLDFFSLGSTSKTASFPPSKSSASAPTAPSLPTLSSAPSIPNFEPPEPTPTDPYPGYYQLPSGSWAAHEPTYYAKFLKKWQNEYDAHVRALEKGKVKGFEGLDSAAVEDVNAMNEMEKAKKELQEREEKKAITKGASGESAQPKMKISASKLSGVARSRHQLSTLLKEAYENREALEEKIAEGRRNRKEAGNKYGF